MPGCASSSGRNLDSDLGLDMCLGLGPRHGFNSV